MSWPLKYDPASQSISFGGRNKTLYPNSLAPFDQAALAAGDISRTYCGRGGERRPRRENELFEVGSEKVEYKNAEGTGSEEDRRPIDTSLDIANSISYTKSDQREESRQKQKRFVESLARGKWNRYRRQYTSNTSTEAHNSTNSFSTNDCASTSPQTPTNMPYLTVCEARGATLNNQAARVLGLKDWTIEIGEWSSDSFLADPAAIIPAMEKNLAIFDVDPGISEAESSTLPERCYSPQLNTSEKQALVIANAPATQEKLVFKHQNKDPSRESNITQNAQSFLQRLLHPTDTIIKPALQFATKVFCFQHNKNNKIQQRSEKQASDVDAVKSVPSKEEREKVEGYEGLL